MMFSDYERYDDDYELPTCEKCGKPLTSDSDGDGVWATSTYFCEHCPDDEPVVEQPKEEQ